MNDLRCATEALMREERRIREASGGAIDAGKQGFADRLSVRQRISVLVDSGSTFFELGIWAAWRMYDQWGEVPAAGVIVGIGRVRGRPVMVVANDSSVKAGVFLPLQDEIFPDEDDFGRIFRNNAVIKQLENPTDPSLTS
ncbi:carboxyl transferase domain-containing protein [Rhodopirellula sp. JC639]|uniref:carboxyl transferase domain-containing protein n=1 Tax=Stieleria mannarensis TaxID=2755585 RepID=UPI001C72399D|nr:carboxyl transferase domain-containing protein [Rhodopirellula sp. JC639]